MTHTIPEAEDMLRARGDRIADNAAELAKTKDDLLKEFKILISEGEELMRQTSNLSGDALALARERFRAQLAAARVQLSTLSDVARARGRDAARMADDYVRDSPWVSVGAAAGLGLMLGILISRRQR